MIALVAPSPTPAPLILVPQQQQQQRSSAAIGDEALRRRHRDNAFPVEEFVEAVQQHRFLYDRNEPDFKNVAMKEAMWEAIGQQFGVSGNKAMSKWRNMRDKYFKIRKQELLNRRLRTPRFQRPVKMWPFYYMMRQVFERKQDPPEDSQSDAAGGHEDVAAELDFDSAWVTDGNIQDHELASFAALHTDNSPPSGGEDDPEVDTDREDFETLASLQSSITMARALFHKHVLEEPIARLRRCFEGHCEGFKEPARQGSPHASSFQTLLSASGHFKRTWRTVSLLPHLPQGLASKDKTFAAPSPEVGGSFLDGGGALAAAAEGADGSPLAHYACARQPPGAVVALPPDAPLRQS
ncbi:uncharacterized protein LOC119163313 isoform X2 [Rhipicephalus microplus]|uniref:uncharacterized protein LOC119163313 isoform X2 n=1 Tax=Rhipicephalus microplus TaxID=6941 RepID=UPI003F6BC7E5